MIAAGETLDGKYTVVRRLGGGGFGEVYLAQESVVTQRHVAIKVLDQSRSGQHSNLVREMLLELDDREALSLVACFSAWPLGRVFWFEPPIALPVAARARRRWRPGLRGADARV